MNSADGSAQRQGTRLGLTRKQIEGWCGPAVYAAAEAKVKRGEVLRVDVDPPWIEGRLARPGGEMRCRFKVLGNGLVDSECPCQANREHGLICSHVAALAINLVQRSRDPLLARLRLEEQRHARRMAAQAGESVRRSPDGRPAALLLELPAAWRDQFAAGAVTLRCAFQPAPDGPAIPPGRLDRRQPLRLSARDDNILCVLEDIAGTELGDAITMGRADFLNVIEVCGDCSLPVADGTQVALHTQCLATQVRMDLDRENGELLLFAHTELPFLRPGEFPAYLVEGGRGRAYGAGHLWPIAPLLPLPYHTLYRGPVTVPRQAILGFLAGELPRLCRTVPFVSDITPDLFTTAPGRPRFRLRLRGSPASLAAALDALYGETALPAGAPETPGAVALPDADDLFHFQTRNLPAEQRALARLAEAGFAGERGDALQPLAGTRAVLNFLGGWMPALRRLGWQIELDGRVRPFAETLAMAVPVVRVTTGEETGDGFEVGIDYEDPDGAPLPPAEVQRALLHGNAFLEHGGRTLLIDRDAVESLRDVFRDCRGSDGSAPGRFRLPAVYAPYVQSSLAAIDGIDVEDPPAWRLLAARQNRDLRLEPEPLGAMETVLRPYQKEGVYWLRFLERGGFGGILADEMGLGKTLQTLAWLQLPRLAEDFRGRPALIVCPTSLVENWVREAARFTPAVRCLAMTGARRHDRWDDLSRHDLVITSYALLRRDLERYAATPFSAVVLDEAQHIKNRSTRNAAAAKRLRAAGRLVLTGTPIENSVADLWSIMDFLMPGYLGAYEEFRASYELPIARGDRAGETAQTRLRRKLHPFLLRRLKREVAAELPAKIEQTSFSALTPDQQRVYNALLARFRRQIGEMVAARGFERCRMEILAVLTRLRQACCHLDLLPRELRGEEQAAAPSAKMEQFLEILDSAMDGGHRVLLFSQFTAMLRLLRRELERRGIDHCYLDGETRERMAEVQRFNRRRSIPVFLVSLKAGGTGLNLTGADMVVHFDPWWNPAVEDQATDRAHRIGQKRTVISLKLIAEHTVEEKVLALQRRKQAVIQAAIGRRDDDPALQSLCWSDVQELLSDD
jgi:superfamily II DNA or RNA helicase